MTPARGFRAIGYARVSTEEQGDSGLSLAAQEEAITQYATERGWTLHMVREVATGTSMKKRPLFRQVLDDLDAGRADVLVVTKLDRLSRSTIDALMSIDRSHRNGWSVVILDLQVDTSTAMGQVFVTVAAAFAQLYRDQISENTRAALAQVMANGSRSGRPIGNHAHRVPAKTIDRIHKARTRGKSWAAIARDLNESGVTGPRGGTWTHWSVAQALRRAGAPEPR